MRVMMAMAVLMVVLVVMRLIAVMIRAAFVEHRRMDVMVQNRALMSGNPEFESCSAWT